MIDCNECRPAIQCASLEKELESLKTDHKELEKKVAALEKSTVINEEQTKMVFKILNEIKDSIKTIADKLDKLEKAPGENWRNLVKVAITVVVTAAVTYFIKK